MYARALFPLIGRAHQEALCSRAVRLQQATTSKLTGAIFPLTVPASLIRLPVTRLLRYPLCFRELACTPRVMAAYKLVLIRHGESCWNQENRFCGWFDADLSETGAEEAKRGGQALKGERSVLCLCGACGDQLLVLLLSK